MSFWTVRTFGRLRSPFEPKAAWYCASPRGESAQKVGFRIVREGKHVVMSDGTRILTVPRANPVNAITMGGIVRDAGLTIEEFNRLL